MEAEDLGQPGAPGSLLPQLDDDSGAPAGGHLPGHSARPGGGPGGSRLGHLPGHSARPGGGPGALGAPGGAPGGSPGHLPGHSVHPGGAPGGSPGHLPGALGASGRGTRRLARSPPGALDAPGRGTRRLARSPPGGARCTREGHPPARQVTSRGHSVHSGGAPGELYHLHSVHTVSGALPEAGHHGTCRAALRLL